MSIGRRHFITSVSAGSAAYLAGCAPPASGPPPSPDGGTACPTPTVLTPPALDQPPPEYFEQLSLDLDAAEIGTPIVIVDLDRMEANIDAIVAGIEGTAAPRRFRIVEKSLPSIELLRLVAARAGQTTTPRFLVLHLPLLGDLLAAFPDADVIVGKTHLTSAVRRFFMDLPAGADVAAIARQVVFLADGLARLEELIDLAGDPLVAVPLRIAVELDVGLRRSGLREPGALGPMLERFFAAPDAVELAGLFGYDGHIAYSPGATATAVIGEWAESTAAYDAFVDVLRADPRSAPLVPDLIFHSGGTSTFSLYSDPSMPTPVNDVATGGGVLRPGEYPDYFLGPAGVSPAIFIAAPVLRTYPATDDPADPEAPQVPFLTPEQDVAVFAGRQGLTIYGGGWPAFFTHPPISGPPLSGPGTGCAWVPNQGLATAAPELDIAPGDWIYFHPTGSDVIFQFERIYLVRGGLLTGETLAAYPRRY